MDSQEIQQPQNHQVVMSRFVAACQADERVVAAFLGGSYARGTADAYSDLDLCLITTDEAYEDFFAGREAFIRLLGEPVFLEDFHGYGVDFVCFIFPDGTEGELALGRESHFNHIHGGPYRVLLDKKRILAGAVFSWHEPAQAEQIETLRHLVYWFWHDLSHHFITALARGQIWSAYGALEELRLTCVNLARLRQNFSKEFPSSSSRIACQRSDRTTSQPLKPEAVLARNRCPPPRRSRTRRAECLPRPGYQPPPRTRSQSRQCYQEYYR